MKSPDLSLGDLLVGGSSFDDSNGWKSVTVSFFNKDGSPGKAKGRRRERRDTESLELEDIRAGTARDKCLSRRQGFLFHLGEPDNLCFI